MQQARQLLERANAALGKETTTTTTTTTKTTTTTTTTTTAAPPVTGKRKAEAPPPTAPLYLRRLTKELAKIAKERDEMRTQLQMEIEPLGEDKIDVWRVKWFYDHAKDANATETQRRLKEQLDARGLEFIEFRLVFPEDYAWSPPFVYNHYPRLQGSFIFSCGGICAETLSKEFGWSPANTPQALVMAVRSLLENAGCRLISGEFPDPSEEPNDADSARKDASSIARIHSSGWHGSAGNS